tara:strand:- start:425 stop:586 length:162 start_codon:yes stop_codon:yes gene_type:complete
MHIHQKLISHIIFSNQIVNGALETLSLKLTNDLKNELNLKTELANGRIDLVFD